MSIPSMLISLIVLLVVTSTAGLTASGTILFDFESGDDISAWKLRTPATDSLKQSDLYATSGKHSMEFHTPEWKTGMEQLAGF